MAGQTQKIKTSKTEETKSVQTDYEGEALTETKTTALTEPDFVRMEKNIVAFGFFTPSSKRIKNAPKVIRFIQTIEGNRVEAEVKISPNVEYGIPITADQDKYLAFQKIIERSKRENGRVENPITFTTSELIKLLGQTDAGLNFKEVYEWLDLMQGTQIKSQGAVWIAGKKRFATDVFNLFSRIKRVGEELDDGTIADKNHVWLSDWYLENLNAHYLLPIDFESYKKLKNNIAKALIPLLQIWLYASRETGIFEKRYDEICQVLHIKIYRYASDVKRFFGRSLDELVAQGYLADWKVVKTSDQKAFKIVFKHGYKFYADRTAVRQLGGHKKREAENRPVETQKDESRPAIPKRKKKAVSEAELASDEVLEVVSEIVREDIVSNAPPDTMTAAHREAIEKLHLEYKITHSKAVELVCDSFDETVRQLEAFPFREAQPKNKAGFLIEAIKRKFMLPDGYYEYLSKKQIELKEAAQREKDLQWRMERESLIAECSLCDENGSRNIKHPEDKKYQALKPCTHNEEEESKFEDWKPVSKSD